MTNLEFLRKKMVKMGITITSYTLIFIAFIPISGFSAIDKEEEKNNFISEYFDYTNDQCRITVDAGDDVSFCEGGETTLTAKASGVSQCCVKFKVRNTKHCRNNKSYVLWLSDGKNKTRYYADKGLKWTEFADGTATLKGYVKNIRNSRDVLVVNVRYSGKISIAPTDSPKDHVCYDENATGWEYYTEVTGTIRQRSGSWSFDISERGPAFQLGRGANITEKKKKKLGASGWFNTTDNKYKIGDFNFNLGECVATDDSEVSYLWSTGETTQTITVNEPGTYTVEVKDCKDCIATDQVKVEEIDLDVDLGEDQTICEGDEITIEASVSGNSECTDCIAYGIEDTYRCKKDLYYVLWLKDDHRNKVRRFRNVDLKWQEFEDGTATLKGTVIENNTSNTTLEVDVTYSGRTLVAPQDSPKDHFCNEENSDGWIYYTGVTGTVTQTDGSWSFDISRMGPAFQLGNGANTTEDEIGKYGASGWFTTTDNKYKRGDFNINIGDCIDVVTSNEVSYLWSTGETTPSITITEEGTYTVTVQDCKDCEASDSVEITFSDPITVDVGQDKEICAGEQLVLTAQVDGDTECEECVDYEVANTNICYVAEDFVIWLSDRETATHYSNLDLKWKENADGTIHVKGTVVSNDDPNVILEVDFTYSGRTIDIPQYSPKEHRCNTENASGWVYFTELTGTIAQTDGSWSYEVERKGEAFQLGNGANIAEREVGRYGASGWFSITTPGALYEIGDLNVNLECIATQPTGVEYMWSTGETTQNITVSPDVDTTYTVIVSGCTECGEETKEINVTVEDCTTFNSETRASTNDFKVYPTSLSPNSTLFVDLQTIKNQSVTISVHNLMGTTIGSMSQKITNNNLISVDLGRFRISPNIYIVRISGSDWVRTEKIVVTN